MVGRWGIARSVFWEVRESSIAVLGGEGKARSGFGEVGKRDRVWDGEGSSIGVWEVRGSSIIKIIVKIRWNTFPPVSSLVMDRISVNSQVHFGKPCVLGTRITVQSVLELLNERLTFEEITQDYYPDLEIEDIRACLQYAISLVAVEEINLKSVV